MDKETVIRSNPMDANRLNELATDNNDQQDNSYISFLPKVQDERLRRVVTARLSGARYKEIAQAEGVSVERARQLRNQGWRLLKLLSQIPETLTADTPVANTLSSVRFRNACFHAEVVTIGDLANLKQREFLRIKNCSSKTFHEARQLLHGAGLKFSDEEDEGQ